MVHVRHACFSCTLSYFASELLTVFPSHTNKTCYPTIPHIYKIYNLSPSVLCFISLQFLLETCHVTAHVLSMYRGLQHSDMFRT